MKRCVFGEGGQESRVLLQQIIMFQVQRKKPT